MKDRYQKIEEYRETIDKGFKNIRMELERIRHEIEHIKKMNSKLHKAGVESESNYSK